MKYPQLLRISIFTLSLLMTGFGTVPAGAAAYTVRQGDTFSKISRRLGVPLPQLLRANPTADPDLITPGLILEIPETGGKSSLSQKKKPPAPVSRMEEPQTVMVSSKAKKITVSAGSYQVKKGDTVYRLATKFGGSPEKLMKLNGLDRPEDLQAGQTLRIPGADQAPAPKKSSPRSGSGGSSSARKSPPPHSVDLTPPPRQASRTRPSRTVAKQPVERKHVPVKAERTSRPARPEPSPFADEGRRTQSSVKKEQWSGMKPPVPVIENAETGRKAATPVKQEFSAEPVSEDEILEESTAAPRVGVRVRPGVKLEEIAEEFQTTPETLRRLNNLSDFDQVQARPMVFVPWPAARTEPADPLQSAY